MTRAYRGMAYRRQTYLYIERERATASVPRGDINGSSSIVRWVLRA